MNGPRTAIRYRRTQILTRLVAAAALLLTASPVSLFADDEPTDPDFFVQGEYVGSLRMDGSGQTPYGLQVVALGGSEFQGSLYRGGLPGSGWDGSERIVLRGARQGDRITLDAADADWVAWMSEENTRHWHLLAPQAGQAVGTLSGVRRQSPTLGLQPSPLATVLFNGSSTEKLEGGEIDEDGLLKEGFLTADPVQDFRLHVEFRTPWEPTKSGQQRGNSGVYIQTRYEVQILDSFGLEELFNGCGSLYRQRAPKLNMALPPRSWQTYDIEFHAARWDADGKKTENARISVRHNGIYIHRDVEIPNKTGAGSQESPEALPIRFQDHSNPVRYRNLWIVPLDKNLSATVADGIPSADGPFSWEADRGEMTTTGNTWTPRRRSLRPFCGPMGRYRMFGWR